MPVRINNISLKNLGPLESLDLNLGLFNLIYGQNESGKTYLVEFLLGALFRGSSAWNLREVPGSGQVSLSGLEKNKTKFSLKMKMKIEDYWDEGERGLPLNMSRLLVVRGGELDMTESPGGVDRSFLKAALTNEYLLDHIRQSISKTVQDANIFKDEIVGAKRGALKEREDLYSEIVQLQGLLDRIEEEYSRGPLRETELEIEKVKEKLANQEQSRRFRAFLLRQGLNQRNKELENLSEDVMDDLREYLHDLQKGELTLVELEESLASHREASQNYPWLESAITTWERMNLEGNKQPFGWLVYVGMVALLLGLILLGINDLIVDIDLFWVGITLALLSGGITTYYLLQLQSWISGIHKSEEKESIQSEFKSRFGSTLNSLSTLREKLQSIQKSYFQVEPLEKSIQDTKQNQDLYKLKIRNALTELTGKSIPEEDWREAYQSLSERSKQLQDSIHELNIELQRLDVPEELEIDQPAADDYDPQLTQKLTQIIEELSEKQNNFQHQLNSLKQLVCHETGDDISSSWVDALYHLRSIFQEKENQYRHQTARLVAEIGVIQILDLVEQEEDRKIQNDINSLEVTSLIKDLTGRYESLDLIGDQLFINDKYSQFPLSELSTGAQEQVLLSLRMGIARQVSEGEPLFLILDDAFQHSDWERRELLVRSIVYLAKSGWQILYLTMDNHLRDLVTKHGKKALGKDFLAYEL